MLPAPPSPWALGLVLLALALAAAPLLVGPFALSVLTEAMVAVLFAASLHFMMGPGGMASFGHAAWFGIGAYAAALATSALACAAALGLAAGAVCGRGGGGGCSAGSWCASPACISPC